MEVTGERENGRVRGRHARGARPFFLVPTTSKRLLRRLLKETLLFQTFCHKLTQVESLNLASGPQLANMDSIHFGVGHFDFIQGYISYK